MILVNRLFFIIAVLGCFEVYAAQQDAPSPQDTFFDALLDAKDIRAKFERFSEEDLQNLTPQNEEMKKLASLTQEAIDQIPNIPINNGTGEMGLTPLIVSVITSNKHVVQALLVNPDLQIDLADVEGNTPVMHATIKSNIPMLLLLAGAGAGLNLPNNEGVVPVQKAADIAKKAEEQFVSDKRNTRYAEEYLKANKYLRILAQLFARQDAAQTRDQMRAAGPRSTPPLMEPQPERRVRIPSSGKISPLSPTLTRLGSGGAVPTLPRKPKKSKSAPE